MKMYHVIMKQVLVDEGWYEADSQEEAEAMAAQELDPEEIEDVTFETYVCDEEDEQ